MTTAARATAVAIFYATRDGHTRLVADHVAARLRGRGFAVEVMNVASLPDTIEWNAYAAVIVAASVHLGSHEAEMVRFARRWRDQLVTHDAAFISVSLSEASAEDRSLPAEQRAAAAAEVKRAIEGFMRRSDWRPHLVQAVAGALHYSRHHPIVRYVLSRIAARGGQPADTSRDYEFTDWGALDRFAAHAVEAALLRPAGAPSP